MSSIYVVFGMFVKATEQNRAYTLDDWARLAQFKNPKRFSEEERISGLSPLDNLYGRWSVADLWSQCCFQDYGDYFCFQIFAHWNDVSDYGLPPYNDMPCVTPEESRDFLREEPSFYKDPRVQIAEDLARACVAMDAEVGVYTQTMLGDKPSYREMQTWLKEYVYDRAIHVGDIRALFSAYPKILFLNDAWYNLMLEKYREASIQELLWVTDVMPDMPKPGYHGALLFTGKGRYRF